MDYDIRPESTDSSLHYHLVAFRTGLLTFTLAARFYQKRCEITAFFWYGQIYEIQKLYL